MLLTADDIRQLNEKIQYHSTFIDRLRDETARVIVGQHHMLDRPFFVLGTQNPIESEGTYPLPEAQLDRFMFKIRVDYPTLDEEIDIALSTTGGRPEALEPVLSKAEILKMQEVVRQVIVARPVAAYAVRLTRATRPGDGSGYAYVKNYLTWGAGPRACQALLMGAKARALLDGRANASIDDIRFIAKPVLRHRLVTNFTAESENISTDDVIEKLIEDLPEVA